MKEDELFVERREQGDYAIRKPGSQRASDVLRWSPFFGQVVKLGSPNEKDGPDDGQAEAVWG